MLRAQFLASLSSDCDRVGIFTPHPLRLCSTGRLFLIIGLYILIFGVLDVAF